MVSNTIVEGHYSKAVWCATAHYGRFIVNNNLMLATFCAQPATNTPVENFRDKAIHLSSLFTFQYIETIESSENPIDRIRLECSKKENKRVEPYIFNVVVRLTHGRSPMRVYSSPHDMLKFVAANRVL